MEIEDVKSRLRETERECFLDLPRNIGKTTELVKFAIEEESKGKNVLFVCMNVVHRAITRDKIFEHSSLNYFTPDRIGDIFLGIEGRHPWEGTTFDIAIFDEFTQMNENNINWYRNFCRKLVGLGTSSRMIEENIEANDNGEIRFNPIIEDELGLDYVRVNNGEDYYTVDDHEIGSQEYGEVITEENYSETDKYLFRLGIFNYLKKVEIDQEDRTSNESLEVDHQREEEESVDMSNVWSVM